MKVDISNLQTLFDKAVCYEVPQFQRRYIWNQEQQWEPLWEDVQNTAERYMEYRDRVDSGFVSDKPLTHFLGAVVLQQQLTMAARLDSRLVVDGQQRLTTLQLLLDAAQEVFERRGNGDEATFLSGLVLNNKVYWRDEPDRAFKVWPTMGDQEAFRHAMRNDLPSDEHDDSLIVRAHEYFKLQIRHWLDECPEENARRIEALERTITNLLEIVVIDLEPTDDPHVIFETLNARGTPLLQSDLVKNLVLYEAGKEGIPSDSNDTDHLWDFAENWWNQEVRQGRLYRPRIDVFLNYWLVMRAREEVTADNVFSAFRRYVGDSSESIETIATDIGTLGKAYRGIEESVTPGMETFLYRRGVMQAGVLIPVLLWLISSGVPIQQFKRGIRALESHLVRRMICRMTTMGHNRLFVSLLHALAESGPKHAGDTIVEYLKAQNSNVGLWPSNEQLEDSFVNLPIYRLLTRGRLRLVLEGIEDELRTGKTEDRTVPRNLTIEHIMPQGWREHWRLSTEVASDIEAAGNRDRLIHSMGNLTLVNKRLNPALSNAPWESKRATINEHSVLFLNKALLDEAPEVWDETAIAERARHLFQEAVKVWPHADDV